METWAPRLCQPAGGVGQRGRRRGTLAESPPFFPSLPLSREQLPSP